MTDVTIRQIHGEEVLEAVYPLTSYAFHASPPLQDREVWAQHVLPRQGVTYYCAFEGGTAVACTASTAGTENVRGALLGMGGVWGVATHPSARRKGYCRELMARQLAAMHEAGQPLSALYPFRESFYQRLGYVLFPQYKRVTFAPATLGALLKQELGGEVEVRLSGAAFEDYRAYVSAMQAETHGMGLFYSLYSDERARDDNSVWIALARVGGEVEGVMVYSMRGEQVTQFKLRATRFYARTARARYLLLQWIARHVDQASEAELWMPPYELPETWLADMRVESQPSTFTPMGRVVDLAGLSQRGVQTGPGAFVAAVTDAVCPWNAGVWRFETVGGELVVAPETGEADCTLTSQGVAALVYGAHDPADFAFRGWGDPSPEAVAALGAVFPRRLPYLHEMF